MGTWIAPDLLVALGALFDLQVLHDRGVGHSLGKRPSASHRSVGPNPAESQTIRVLAQKGIFPNAELAKHQGTPS